MSLSFSRIAFSIMGLVEAHPTNATIANIKRSCFVRHTLCLGPCLLKDFCLALPGAFMNLT
jgi:hypothetical protein